MLPLASVWNVRPAHVLSVNVGEPLSTALAMNRRLYRRSPSTWPFASVGGPLSPSVWYIRVCPSGVAASAISLRSAAAPQVPTNGLAGSVTNGSTAHGWMFVQVAPLSVERQ